MRVSRCTLSDISTYALSRRRTKYFWLAQFIFFFVHFRVTMNFFDEPTSRPSLRISCPMLGLFALVFFSCIASDGKSVGIITGYTPKWNETWTDRLKRDLLLHYDKFARPAHHLNSTQVSFDIHINEVILDEFKSSMIVQAWVSMVWQDEKLQWNASNYDGLNRLYVGNHEIWQPDVLLYNSIAGASIEHYGDTHCIILPSGSVLWTPPTQFHALCDLDLRYWPFDTQHCYLQLGSWMYSANEIDLQLSDSTMQTKPTKQYSQWDLISVTRNRTLTSYGYVTLFYNITIRRHSPMYYATIVTPTATIVFLTLVIFWLPPHSKEKLILCSFTALIISVFLMYFGQKLPPLSGKLPLLICFYTGCLHLVTFSLILSAFVINLSRHPHCRPLPRKIKTLLSAKFGQYLGLSDHMKFIDSRRPAGEQELRENRNTAENNYQRSNSLSSGYSENGERENIILPTMSTVQLEWNLAAMAIDRFAFFLFSIIFAMMAMICLV